jgi:acetolactate synthase-1/2/3 large subunit
MIDGLKLVRLAGEPKQNLQILIERLTANPNPLSPSSCKFRPSCPENGKMGMEEIIGHLAAAMSDDADVFADAGNCGASVIHYLPVSGRGVFSVALGMGAMGHSFGCAIGSAAYRRRETWVFAGDGAYFMHGWEIHTAWQYQLPIVFVIFDNSSHGMCVIREDIYLRQRTELNTFKPSRLGQGVAATWPQFPAWEVTSIEELQQALCELKAEPSGPKFLSIQVSATEIPPFLPFITANNN